MTTDREIMSGYPGLWILKTRARQVNLNTVISKLGLCSDKHNDCRDCSKERECTNLFDERCGMAEVLCPHCGDSVPVNKLCSNCGLPLAKKGG